MSLFVYFICTVSSLFVCFVGADCISLHPHGTDDFKEESEATGTTDVAQLNINLCSDCGEAALSLLPNDSLQ